MRTVIYTRLSSPKDPEQKSTGRQEADARALCERRGWPVAEVYSEPGRSAWKKGAKRPELLRLLADAEGEPTRVVVWKIDRLNRQPADLERLIDVLTPQAGGIVSDVEGEFTVGGDGDDSQDLFMLRFHTLMANHESNNTSRRVRRAMEQLASEGKPNGGGRRAFGRTADWTGTIPEEVELIEEAVSRIFEGDNLNNISNDWHQRGIVNTGGSPFTHTTLRRTLLSPSISGLRHHKGTVVGEAAWESIISEETRQGLMNALAEGRNPRRYGHPNIRTHLLSGGLARCGLCGAALTARPTSEGKRRYVCASPSSANTRGCGGIYVMAQPVEDLVADAVFAYLDTPAFDKLVHTAAEEADAADIIERLDADKAALARAEEGFVEGVVSKATFLKKRAEIEERIAAHQSRLDRALGEGFVAALPRGADAVRAAWAERELRWRRALLDSVIEKVTINRSGRVGYHAGVLGRRFDPSRVEIAWR